MYCKDKCLIWSARLPATALTVCKQICSSLLMGYQGKEIFLQFELGGRIEII